MFVKQIKVRNYLLKIGSPLVIMLLVMQSLSAQYVGGLGCASPINLSLDPSNCEITVTPDMILSDADYMPSVLTGSGYTVVVTDLFDNPVGEDSIYMMNTFVNLGLEHLGQQLKASVTENEGGNSCWGFVNLEFKFVNNVTCPTETMTVSCLQDPKTYAMPMFPQSTCDVSALIEQVGEDVVTDICEDPDLPGVIAIVTRTFQAINTFGGTSDFCTVDYHVTEFSLSQVTIPTQDTILACNNTDDAADVGLLGVPFLDIDSDEVFDEGVDVLLYPTPKSFCNILVTLEMDTIFETSCETKILRQWTVQQWLCNNEEKIEQKQQLLTLKDFDGPEILLPAPGYTMMVDANSASCMANVNMPTLTINDDCSEVVSVRMEYFPHGSSNTNGGYIILPAGEHEVTYIATDACGTDGTNIITVIVNEDTPPVVLCEKHVVVSLTNNGTAIVPASVFDDGSYGCNFKEVLVAKMTDACNDTTNLEFGPTISFCCNEADPANTPMIRIRAYNYDGTWNECMTEVILQDKQPVSLICPPDITVSCDFVFDDNDLGIFGNIAFSEGERKAIVLDATIAEFDGVARDGLATGGCDVPMSNSVDRKINEECGTGTITRTFTVSNGPNRKVCTQTITFVPTIRGMNEMMWPRDTIIDAECSNPDTHPDVLGRPSFNEGSCQQLGSSYTDEVYTNVQIDGTCRKILRYWNIIDWCDRDLTGNPRRYDSVQVIKIVKTKLPEITSCTDNRLFEGVDPSCQVADVSITATVDDCPDPLQYSWQYFLDHDCDGTIDATGTTNTISGTFDAGKYCITWYATDLCGNVSEPCEEMFEVRNNKGPTPVCIYNLAADLIPMDLDNDGNYDTEMTEVNAKQIDSGSSQSCGNPIQVSFSADVNDTVRVYNCNDIGLNEVELWVTDLVTGKQAFCETKIDVQDNNTINTSCVNLQTGNAVVSGLLTNESGDKISDAEVELLGSELPSTNTGADGTYAFGEMPTGGNYTVMAEKNHDVMNGVSTLDLVMIQKHILGLRILDSPFKIIAADINKSNHLSAADIVELRKLVLGEIDDFPNNASWRFVDKSYTFPQPTNPWSESFPEEYDINNLGGSMDINFTGLKVGDVSGNASPNIIATTEVRSSNKNLELIGAMNSSSDSDNVAYTVTSSNFSKVSGMQFTMKYDLNKFEFVGVEGINLDVTEDNIGTRYSNRGAITFSWGSADELSLQSDDILFVLNFRPLTIGSLEINVGSSITTTEAYIDGEVSHNVNLTTKYLGGLTVNQNEPNPWKDYSEIGFAIDEAGTVNARVMDLTGKIIYSTSGFYTEGAHTLRIERSSVGAGGIYLYELSYKGQKQVRKMIVID